MNTSKLSPFILLVAVACHGDGGPQTPVDTDTLVSAPSLEADRAQAQADARSGPPSATLERGVAHGAGITEATLDPRGEAALTLDSHGYVRLWPELTSSDASASAPYRVPVDEPLWMSLAQTGDGGFTLGFIGTNNAGVVYRVEASAGAEATITESFALSPEDPVLELHVLDGGERVLVLGIDHRVRLYDRSGGLISVIDARGFGPWQLRVVGGVGEPPKIAAMLAQPLRVQRISLVDDALEIVGEAREVDLDRGPNRNDLALSPDGKTVAAMRRPWRKHRQWSIELIDLETDERKLIAGRTDTLVRPRLHFVDNDRLLLESGTGSGYWVDLADARARNRRDDFDPDSSYARRLSRRLNHEQIALPASAEAGWALPDDDSGIRMHASVVNGVRVSIDVLDGRSLVVGRLADDAVFRSFAHRPAKVSAGAFDREGSRVAWAAGDHLLLDSLGQDGGLTSYAHELGPVHGLAFVDAGRVMVFGHERAALLDLETGAIEDTEAVSPVEQAIADPGPVELRELCDTLGNEGCLLAGDVAARVSSPDDSLLAVAQLRALGSSSWSPKQLMVSVIEVESGERLWTQGFPLDESSPRLSWSDDGSRLSLVAHSKGWVFDARAGEILVARTHMPLEVAVIPSP